MDAVGWPEGIDWRPARADTTRTGARIVTQNLEDQFAESARLDQAICENLAKLGYAVNRESKR